MDEEFIRSSIDNKIYSFQDIRISPQIYCNLSFITLNLEKHEKKKKKKYSGLPIYKVGDSELKLKYPL